MLSPIRGRDTLGGIAADDTAAGPPVRAILLVEGETDCTYLSRAAAISGRSDLLAGVALEPAYGSLQLFDRARALLAESPHRPLVVLVDNDEEARKLQHRLKAELNLRPGEQLLDYGELFEAPFDWEAEDLFPEATLRAWLAEVGEGPVTATRRRPGGGWHLDLSQDGKGEFAEWIQVHGAAEDFARFVEVLERVRVAVARQVERERKRAAHHDG